MSYENSNTVMIILRLNYMVILSDKKEEEDATKVCPVPHSPIPSLRLHAYSNTADITISPPPDETSGAEPRRAAESSRKCPRPAGGDPEEPSGGGCPVCDATRCTGRGGPPSVVARHQSVAPTCGGPARRAPACLVGLCRGLATILATGNW